MNVSLKDSVVEDPTQIALIQLLDAFYIRLSEVVQEIRGKKKLAKTKKVFANTLFI